MLTFQYYTESDVDRTLNMSLAIEAMEEAFIALADAKAHNVPRVRAKAKGIVLHSMNAAADYLGLVGWKQYTTTRSAARFHVGVYDQNSGALKAMIEADRLGQLRTGAVTGLAARHLSSPDAQEVAVIGAGWQAQSQLAAIVATCPIENAVCYCRTADRRAAFCEKMSRELNINVVPAETARAAVVGRPIVVTATTSPTPVLDRQWLASHTLVCAVGSNWLTKAELDVATIQEARLVVCDSVDCCKREAGDFTQAIEQDLFRWSDAVELADIVSGRFDEARVVGDGPTVFKSVGMAIEDIALAAKFLSLVNTDPST